MYTRRVALLMLLLLQPLTVLAAAADTKNKYLINPNDRIKTILKQKIDLAVKLRLKTGYEINGTVVRVGVNVVQIAEVGGMDFYDAVIIINDISVVLFKVRGGGE